MVVAPKPAAVTARPATATSTARSMTAAGSCTPRSSTTNKARPPPRSGAVPPPGSRMLGITCERVITDNGACYRSRAWHTRVRRHAHDGEEDAPLPAPNQRQSRALPPDPARGMGLHPPLDLRSTTRHRLHTASCTSTITTDPTARSDGQHPPASSGTTSPPSTPRVRGRVSSGESTGPVRRAARARARRVRGAPRVDGCGVVEAEAGRHVRRTRELVRVGSDDPRRRRRLVPPLDERLPEPCRRGR